MGPLVLFMLAPLSFFLLFVKACCNSVYSNESPQYLWRTFYLELQIDENEVVKPEYHAEVFPYPGNVYNPEVSLILRNGVQKFKLFITRELL